MNTECPQDESCPWYNLTNEYDGGHSVLECGHPSGACTGCRGTCYPNHGYTPDELETSLGLIRTLRLLTLAGAVFWLVVIAAVVVLL